jgi:hypothetical protein
MGNLDSAGFPCLKRFANLANAQGCEVHNALMASDESILDLQLWIEA